MRALPEITGISKDIRGFISHDNTLAEVFEAAKVEALHKSFSASIYSYGVLNDLRTNKDGKNVLKSDLESGDKGTAVMKLPRFSLTELRRKAREDTPTKVQFFPGTHTVRPARLAHHSEGVLPFKQNTTQGFARAALALHEERRGDTSDAIGVGEYRFGRDVEDSGRPFNEGDMGGVVMGQRCVKRMEQGFCEPSAT